LFLKAWGYPADAIKVFDKTVGANVKWEPFTKRVESVEITSPATQIRLPKETFFNIYDLVKQKNEKPTIEIFRYSFDAVGSDWDLLDYSWGKGYIGFKFYKAFPWGVKTIPNKNLLFPIISFPKGKQQIDSALVTLWCREIAKYSKGENAKNFSDLANRLLDYSVVK